MRRRIFSLLMIGLYLVLTGSGFSTNAVAKDADLTMAAQWRMANGRLGLVIPLASTLTSKQKSIIDGGFTTVSQVLLKWPKTPDADGNDDLKPIYSVRCTVKFDAWEETYDVLKLDEAPRAALVKQLSEYGDLCLKVELDDQPVITELAKSGGQLIAQLIVKQTSLEEAKRIKDWLIQQQSGVMQSLFSHMLGELSLTQTLKVAVMVSPRTATGEKPGKLIPVAKGEKPTLPDWSHGSLGGRLGQTEKVRR